MLKIKDDVNINILKQRYNFIEGIQSYYYLYETITENSQVVIDKNSRLISYNSGKMVGDILYNLIKDDLVEKLEE